MSDTPTQPDPDEEPELEWPEPQDEPDDEQPTHPETTPDD